MSELFTIVGADGCRHEVTVLGRFSEKIDGQMFGFVLHKAVTVKRYVLSHSTSGVRLEILKNGDVESLGMIAAGKKTLQNIIEKNGERKVSLWLLSHIDQRMAASDV